MREHKKIGVLIPSAPVCALGQLPLISKGSLCPHPSRLRRATFPQGKALGNGLPHQSADWFAMTTYIEGFFDTLTSPIGRGKAVKKPCHCEAVRTLPWQSVPFVPPWFPLWGSCHEVTERVQIALSALTGHLSHRERQVSLIRHGYAVPPKHYCAIATGNC